MPTSWEILRDTLFASDHANPIDSVLTAPQREAVMVQLRTERDKIDLKEATAEGILVWLQANEPALILPDPLTTPPFELVPMSRETLLSVQRKFIFDVLTAERTLIRKELAMEPEPASDPIPVPYYLDLTRCFAAPAPPPAVDTTRLTDEWIEACTKEVFSSLPSSADGPIKATFLERFKVHVGPNSTYSELNPLSAGLRILYERMTDPRTDPSVKAGIAQCIYDGVMHCVQGLQIRCTQIIHPPPPETTLDGHLLKARTELVEKIASAFGSLRGSIGNRVHFLNDVFTRAAGLVGTQALVSHDPYHSGIPSYILQEIIATLFEVYYKPIDLIKAQIEGIPSLLKAEGYIGPSEYDQATINHIFLKINERFGTSFSSSSDTLRFELDEDGLETSEYDLNWDYINAAILKQYLPLPSSPPPTPESETLPPLSTPIDLLLLQEYILKTTSPLPIRDLLSTQWDDYIQRHKDTIEQSDQLSRLLPLLSPRNRTTLAVLLKQELPLISAINRDTKEVGVMEEIKDLIQSGLDINQTNHARNTALRAALSYKSEPIIKALLAHPLLDLSPLCLTSGKKIDYFQEAMTKTPHLVVKFFQKAIQSPETLKKLYPTADDPMNELCTRMVSFALTQSEEIAGPLFSKIPTEHLLRIIHGWTQNSRRDTSYLSLIDFASTQDSTTMKDILAAMKSNAVMSAFLKEYCSAGLIKLSLNNELKKIKNLLLLDPSIKINQTDEHRDTALTWAVYKGHTDIVNLLLAHPAIDITCRNTLPPSTMGHGNALEIAMEYHPEFVLPIFQKAILLPDDQLATLFNPAVSDPKRHLSLTLLTYAFSKSAPICLSLLKALKEHLGEQLFQELNTQRSKKHEYALIDACHYHDNSNNHEVSELLQLGANINASRSEKDLNRPLTLAICAKNYDKVMLLLAHTDLDLTKIDEEKLNPSIISRLLSWTHSPSPLLPFLHKLEALSAADQAKVLRQPLAEKSKRQLCLTLLNFAYLQNESICLSLIDVLKQWAPDEVFKEANQDALRKMNGERSVIRNIELGNSSVFQTILLKTGQHTPLIIEENSTIFNTLELDQYLIKIKDMADKMNNKCQVPLPLNRLLQAALPDPDQPRKEPTDSYQSARDSALWIYKKLEQARTELLVNACSPNQFLQECKDIITLSPAARDLATRRYPKTILGRLTHLIDYLRDKAYPNSKKTTTSAKTLVAFRDEFDKIRRAEEDTPNDEVLTRPQSKC